MVVYAMRRRLFGAILCLFVISAGATATYAGFAQLYCGIAIYLEPSFFSLDLLDDDFADTGYPDGLVNRSGRDKVPLKLSVGFKAKIAKFTAQALPQEQSFANPSHSQQELYRYQEVFRI
jgi:hypothetical protein